MSEFAPPISQEEQADIKVKKDIPDSSLDLKKTEASNGAAVTSNATMQAEQSFTNGAERQPVTSNEGISNTSEVSVTSKLADTDLPSDNQTEANPTNESFYGSVLDVVIGELDNNAGWRIKQNREQIIDLLENLNNQGRLNTGGDVLEALEGPLREPSEESSVESLTKVKLKNIGPKTARKAANAIASVLGIPEELQLDETAPEREALGGNEPQLSDNTETITTILPTTEDATDEQPTSSANEPDSPSERVSPADSVQAATESATVADQDAEVTQSKQVLTREQMKNNFNKLFDTNHYIDNLCEGDAALAAKITLKVEALLSKARTSDRVTLREMTILQIRDELKNSGKLRKNQDAKLGLLRKLMDQTFGADSRGSILFTADGRQIRPGEQGYDELLAKEEEEIKQQGEAMAALEAQELSREASKNKLRGFFRKFFRINSKNGGTEIKSDAQADTPADADSAAEASKEASTTEASTPDLSVKKPTDESSVAISEGAPSAPEPMVASPAQTDVAPADGGMAPAVEAPAPELTIKAPTPVIEALVEAASEGPAAPELTGAAPVVKSAPEEGTTQAPETAAEAPEIAPEEVPVVAAQLEEEQNVEVELQMMADLTNQLVESTKDEIKGLNKLQLAALSEASKLVDKYQQKLDDGTLTPEQVTVIEQATAAAADAFQHHENYLIRERQDSWESRVAQYKDLIKLFDPSLNLEDPDTAEALNQKIVEKFGKRPKASEQKAQRAEWRSQVLDLRSEARKQTVEQKRTQGKEVTEAAIQKTVEVVGRGVGEVMAVPDHLVGAYDKAATKVLRQVDRVQSALDKAGNVAGAVADEAIEFVRLLPEGVAIGATGIAIATSEVREQAFTAVESVAKAGFNAVKEAVMVRVNRMKEQSAERKQRREQARQEYRKLIDETLEQAAQKRQNAESARGLLGMFKKLRAR